MISGKRVIVVGGGSAGMTAAVFAARAGARVTVLERMHRVGRKLLATGNGRCNLTNLDLDPSRYHGSAPAFPLPLLRAFGAEETIAFFRELGIEPTVEEGRVYPRSGQASSVLDVLRFEMEQLSVSVHCDARVRSVRREGGRFLVVPGEREPLEADRVVIAAGGMAAPNLGSNGTGFGLAESLGHTLVKPFPALTRLRLDSPHPRRLKGLKFQGALTLTGEGGPGRREEGEVLFTERGISGPPVLQVSRGAAERLQRKEAVGVFLDVFPDLSLDLLARRLEDRFAAQARKTIETALVGLVHKRLIPALLSDSGLDGSRPAGAGAAGPLARTMKGWTFSVSGTDGWMDAQVTAGGVATPEVDPLTLESRLVPGLFLAGEILDVDGDCGGFNLQWAWASGRAAGLAAAGRE